MGLRPLASQYGSERLEAASTRAVRFKLCRLDNVRSILAPRVDQQPLPQVVTPAQPVTHNDIPGAPYYAAEEGPAECQEAARCGRNRAGEAPALRRYTAIPEPTRH